MKVILVRHGETYANCEKKFAGWTDTRLTQRGIEQGKAASQRIDMDQVDLVISSDLSRAVETAEYVMGDSNLVITRLADLREMHFGDWENLNIDDMKAKNKEGVALWWKDYIYYQTPNGESLKEMYDRVIKTYENLLNIHRGKNILLVTHSGVMRAILSKELCGSVEGYWKFKIENCAVIEIEYVDGFPVVQFN